MRLRHVLSAAIAGIGLGGSFAHATLSVSLVQVAGPNTAAVSADASLNGARVYDIDVTQTGEQFQGADVKIQLAGGTSGSFYTGGSGAAAAYNTSVNTPSGSTNILGSSDYPSQTQSNPTQDVITSSGFDVSWGQLGFTAQPNGTYEIAQITVLGNTGGFITGYTTGTVSQGRNFLQNNATGSLGTSLAAATPDPTQTSPGGVMYLPLAGDADLDGTVGLSDLNIVKGHLGTTGATLATGDLDADGTVGLSDLNIVKGSLGISVPAYSNPTDGAVPEASLGAIVPEPTSLGLISLTLIGLVSRRRK